MSRRKPNVALVHDWLVAHRGGEQVLLELARMYPEAPIYTLVAEPEQLHPELRCRALRTSFIQQLPGAPARFRQYLPLFPAAIERFDLSRYDLVLSTSHCVAKGVLTHPGQVHISYVHTPMRYLYDQLPEYLPAKARRRDVVEMVRFASTPLRRWDQRSAQRPDVVVANSAYVAARIRAHWHRQAEVVHPPVDVAYFRSQNHHREGWLVVSALVPYKRVDLAVAWATARQEPLTVLGGGSEQARLKAMAGPTVRFLGSAAREELRAAYRKAKGLLFCGREDFGIVPVEAMAAGCPVVALGEGGALESVSSTTGEFFAEPTQDALEGAIYRLERRLKAGELQPEVLSAHAKAFGRAAFKSRMTEVIEAATGASRRAA